MRTLLIWTISLLALGPGFGQTRGAGVNREQVIAAIDWGRTHEVQPYPLRPAFPHSTPYGAIFTPFVRIALAARAKTIEGGALDPDRLPESLVEPLVDVAIWGGGLEEACAAAPLRMELLPRLDSSLLGSASAIGPTWFSEGEGPLAGLGATLPREVAVGAFTLEDLSRSGAVALYRIVLDSTGAKSVCASWGVITKEDVGSWR